MWMPPTNLRTNYPNFAGTPTQTGHIVPRSTRDITENPLMSPLAKSLSIKFLAGVVCVALMTLLSAVILPAPTTHVQVAAGEHK